MENKYKQEFIEIYNKYITRKGADKLLEWIEKTDFFTAPASTKYHGACECGLVMHSLNVYKVLRERYFEEGTDSEESYALCALLHDFCKANFYTVSTRNQKDPKTGEWKQVPYYAVDDKFPYGHGEKSVFLIERYVKLSLEEAMAIRWHMGGFDESVKGGSFALSKAFCDYPLAVKLHLADLEATYLLEKGTSEVNR